MLYESATLGVSTVDGVATVHLSGPTLPELAAAVAIVADTPGLEVVVLRGRFAPPWYGEPLSFAVAGQRLTRAVEGLAPVTVAFIEGPCRGPALELALACDHRLAVAGPDSWVGYPTPPCWGGTARGRVVTEVTAREAVRLGLFTDACSARRGGIELQLLIDRQLKKPRKRTPPRNLEECEAAERRTATLPPTPAVRWEPLPATVGLVGPELGELAGELAARGVRVCGDTGGAEAALAGGLRRGRWTPLEYTQARGRLTAADPHAADWTVSTAGVVKARPGRLVTLPGAAPGWMPAAA